jgi:hypothetical protein
MTGDQEPEFAGPKYSSESREFPNIHERAVAPVDLGANVNTFEFLVGVPKAMVCDNLKAGVTTARANDIPAAFDWDAWPASDWNAWPASSESAILPICKLRDVFDPAQ